MKKDLEHLYSWLIVQKHNNECLVKQPGDIFSLSILYKVLPSFWNEMGNWYHAYSHQFSIISICSMD